MLLLFSTSSAATPTEVWVGSDSLNGLFRHDTQGNYLGHIDFAPLGASRTVSAIAFIPEPSTALLLGFGLVGLGVNRRRRRASR